MILKISRLLEIVTILLNRESITAQELARRFDVSTRTIYRDIEVLSLSGVPVHTNRGNGGGISLLEDYTLNKALLSKSESESLLLAIKTLGAMSYPEADAVIEKIGSIFKSSQPHDWIEVSFEGWSCKTNEQDRFRKIRDAIISGKVISFDYVNNKGSRSNRLAQPVKLIFNTSTWYLIAHCLKRDSYRMFRLSRIKNVQVTAQSFTQREVQKHEEQAAPHAPFIDFKLRCNERVLNRLYDTFDEECITQNNNNDNDSYILTATIPEDEWVYEYVLSLGSNAEVLEPEHVRKEIKARAKAIAGMY
ncbi:MAG: YafY family transcriptional regulator [Coriobacteriia bacterium]|nr:YafY family transcriptional regulator [Coriobacteriia bacterium]